MTVFKFAAITFSLLLVAALSPVTRSQDEKAKRNSQFVNEEIIYLNQGWSAKERQVFYHTSVGVRLIPYRWLPALEAPGTKEPFLTDERIRRYGLIPDSNSLNNADHLPVGFAKEVTLDGEFISVTCAACHTGQIVFNGKNLRIDGGASFGASSSFIINISVALASAYNSPITFRRFSNKVLGENSTPSDRSKLHSDVREAFFTQTYSEVSATLKGLYPVQEGFGRLDVLGRSGNSLLANAIGDNRNLTIANGPVGLPHLWGTPFFDWTQWNGSMSQPLARNIAEALGLSTPVTLKASDPKDLFKSDVDIKNLFLIEETLKKLEPPRWPEDILGKIDQAKAAQGEALYNQHCAACHESKMTDPNEFGKTFVRINMYGLALIGTDPTAAVNFNKRLAYTGQLTQPPASLPARLTAANVLEAITSQVAKRKFEELNISPEMQNEMNGFRRNVMRAPLAYRARNMDGIWATPPYLHNNSVPSIYQLLLPASQRDKSFFVGSLQYDPNVLGFVTTKSEGAFELKTNITGNSNAGHEFREGLRANGVIGPLLTDAERWAIIEYLKTK